MDNNHTQSSTSDNVSTLWTRLISTELDHVHNNPELSTSLLNKQIINSNKIKNLALQANSSHSSASFYYRIVKYIDRNATNDLRRMSSFISELGSGNVYMKSTKKAQRYRQLGNVLFKQGNLSASAIAYRTGLLYAPNAYFIPSICQNNDFCIEGALLHGNLSVILAHQQLWSSCLETVLTALELHLNVTTIKNCEKQSPIFRLKSRFEQCCNHLDLPMLIEWDSTTLTSHKLLEVHAKLISILMCKSKNCVMKLVDIPKPKYNHNPLYYGLSNGVRVATNHEQGRHIIATQPFEPGDIIAVEPAGGWIMHNNSQSYSDKNTHNDDYDTFEYLLLLPSQRMNQCFKCFSQLNSIGFICPYCCDAAYCELSSGCNSQQFVNIENPSYLFHDFQQPIWHVAECRFMFLLNSIGLGHLCFRLAWLRQHYSHSMNDNNNSYFTTDQLIEHFIDFPVDELFEYALTGWLISKILNYNDNNNKTDLKSSDKEFIQGLWCFDTLRRLQCNAHAITEIQASYPDIESWFPNQASVNNMDRKLIYPFMRRLQQIRIATGLFPCVSLLNHSCDPNTIHNFQKSYLILRCLKSIAPGGEVFNCYGPHYLHYSSSSQRLTLLQQQYFFACQCEHCSKPVQFSSSSSPLILNELGVIPTNEMLAKWKDAVNNLLALPWESSLQSIENLKNAIQTIQNIGTLNSTSSWWPSDDNLGSLLDTLGRQYLIYSKLARQSLTDHNEDDAKSKWLFAQNSGLWCLQKSVQWVKLHFGAISCEYLWELISFLYLSMNCSHQSNDSIQQFNLSEEFRRLDDECFELHTDSTVFSDQNSILSEINKLSMILYGSYKSQLIIEKFVHV
ncbi:SET and MYND domain-containing protein 4 [Schistosoma japonicum]|nr:SET and MYND domain-containing protein 4 [Schistosoma japonicum]KAH8873477.1 SET and MYND domain-containing protein 4 [Schistosoma japonicum]